MKVKVEFTIEFDTTRPQVVANLKEVAGDVETMSDVREFVKGEAAEMTRTYFDDMGCRPSILRES